MSSKRPSALLIAALACCLELGAAPAAARLLLLESTLDAHAPLAADSRRFEFGATHFGAARWTGQRHTLRYAGSRGQVFDWAIALPWLYSSYANGGRSGRDNLQIGGSLRLAGGALTGLRLTGDLWLPFTDDVLYPLAQRRAFVRAGLIGRRSGSRSSLALAIAFQQEAAGLGPKTVGPAWSDQLDGELRLTWRWAEHWSLIGDLGLSRALEPVLTWGCAGGGLGLAWGEGWRLDVTARAGIGAEAEPDRQDYSLRLVLRRDRALPSEGAAAPAAPPGGDAAPPPAEEPPADGSS